MNIVLLGHFDIASLFAIDRVIRSLPEHRHAVFLSSDRPSSTIVDARLAALYAADGKLCRRFLSGSVCGPVASELAASPVESLDDPNSSGGRRKLADLRPDLVLSIRYRRILRDAAIAIPRLGVLNLHSGILPDYRGVMATFWAMLAGDREIGTTLHRIVDSGIDTGPILDIRRSETRPEVSYLGNVLGLYAEGCAMMTAAVRTVERRELPGEFPAGKGRYFSAPGAGDISRFEARGLTLFDGGEVNIMRALRSCSLPREDSQTGTR
jgi:methionyl-tRNA formyltransferase